MTLTAEELQNLLLHSWEESLRPMSPDEALQYRSIRLKAFDGQCLPHLYRWPKDIRVAMFSFQFPPTYLTTKKMFIFLVGNGCSPFFAGTWILSYFALLIWNKRDNLARARIQSIIKLYSELLELDCEHYYWDVKSQSQKSFS